MVKVKIRGDQAFTGRNVPLHFHQPICSRAEWMLPVFTMLSIAASSPAFRGAGGWGCWGGGIKISSCSSTSSLVTVAVALFFPLRFFSALSCLAVLGLVCVDERVGVGAGTGSGTGEVTGGGVGGFSTTGGNEEGD